MNCTRCGAGLPPGSTYCPYCRTQLAYYAPPPVVMVYPQVPPAPRYTRKIVPGIFLLLFTLLFGFVSFVSFLAYLGSSLGSAAIWLMGGRGYNFLTDSLLPLLFLVLFPVGVFVADLVCGIQCLAGSKAKGSVIVSTVFTAGFYIYFMAAVPAVVFAPLQIFFTVIMALHLGCAIWVLLGQREITQSTENRQQ